MLGRDEGLWGRGDGGGDGGLEVNLEEMVGKMEGLGLGVKEQGGGG